ncbi:hypothetical protein A6R68_05407 [Neotoma lepida]|uniref:Immunoglobulin V-set domain-containing protein n=1 Tax=Neotoma lepida TaxID=56216 RepID=A0A1A6GIF6_NEOLE|nr:hypothetical protein A6R68_05407 [Neotoma lepida]
MLYTSSKENTVYDRGFSDKKYENTIVHWYQLKEGEPLKRIFYGSAKTYKQDKPNSRLETDEKNDGTFYLIINNVITADEATYYCACWDLTVSHHLKEPDRVMTKTVGPVRQQQVPSNSGLFMSTLPGNKQP